MSNPARHFETSRFDRLLARIDALSIPPFKGAHIFVLVLAVLHAILDPTASYWTGDLRDPDNSLYLLQALDLLNGQNWYDAIQYRLNPPEGTFVHYSRILSAFYAGIISLFLPFMPPLTAAYTTAAIAPCLYLAGLLFVARKTAQRLVHIHWGDGTALLITLSPCIIYRLLPGFVDHHALVLLLSLFSFGCIVQILTSPKNYRSAAWGGLSLALALALALESLAIALILCAFLGVWAVIKGTQAAQSALVFSLSLFLGSVVFLFIVQSPDRILSFDLMTFSIVYVLLTGSFALCFALVAAFSKKPLWRFLLGGGAAALLATVFLVFFPALREGPYGAMDPALAKLIFTVAPESWPLFGKNASLSTQISMLLCPVLALGPAAFLLLKSKTQVLRWAWSLVFSILLATILLTAFYQNRFVIYAQMYAVFPLTAAIFHFWTTPVKARTPERLKNTFCLAVFLMAAPLTTLSYYYFSVPRQETAQNQNAAHLATSARGCDTAELAKTLNARPGLGEKSRTIINTINHGTIILLRTPHKVLAGPYHHNVRGNLEAQRFLSTPHPEEARVIADRNNTDLIVICSTPDQLWGYPSSKDQENKPFVRQLIDKNVPSWLAPIETPTAGDYLLFAVTGAQNDPHHQ